MNICIISEHYFPLIGGTSVHTREITKNIAEINPKNKIYLITISNKTYQDEIENNKNIHPKFLKVPQFLQKERYTSFFLAIKLLKVCLKEKIDIIHVTYGFFSIIYAVIIAKLLRIKIVFTIQNVPPEEHSITKSKLTQRLYHFILRIFSFFSLGLPYNRLICVSKYTANLARATGVKKDKISIIPNGIDDIFFKKYDKEKLKTEFNLPKDEIIILNVAGIIAHKGQDLLIKAFSKVNKNITNCTLILIGPIRDRHYFITLKNLVRINKIKKKVLFLGEKDHSDLPKYYSIADIYIQPSLQEGFCLAILEAMSCNIPVIGTDVGAISEFIGNNDRGILIKQLNLENLERSILNLIENSNFRKEIVKNGEDFVKNHYNWKFVAKKTYKLYQKLIS